MLSIVRTHRSLTHAPPCHTLAEAYAHPLSRKHTRNPLMRKHAFNSVYKYEHSRIRTHKFVYALSIVCTRTHTHTPHMHALLHSHACTRACSLNCIHAHSQTRTYTHRLARTLTDSHACSQTRTHSHSHVQTDVQSRTRTHLHACTQKTHALTITCILRLVNAYISTGVLIHMCTGIREQLEHLEYFHFFMYYGCET